jgi:hypothetical protein
MELLALLLILALASYLRLANNTDNPGWYTAEGTHLDIARHLAQGQIRYLAINQSTLITTKLPLFEVLRDRFIFEPDHTGVHFVVVDNLWYNWARWNVAGVAATLDHVEIWPMVFQSGAVRVYSNAEFMPVSPERTEE